MEEEGGAVLQDAGEMTVNLAGGGSMTLNDYITLELQKTRNNKKLGDISKEEITVGG